MLRRQEFEYSSQQYQGRCVEYALVESITMMVYILRKLSLGSKGPDLIEPEDEKIDVERGYETSLECRDTAAFPKPTVQWFMRTVRFIH